MDHRHTQADLKGPASELRREIPEVMAAFASLASVSMGDGELEAKTKELIALAIAVTKECDGCIAAHARGAVRRGATRSEVAEMIGVTIMMNGGPGTVWGPRALEAFDQFSASA